MRSDALQHITATIFVSALCHARQWPLAQDAVNSTSRVCTNPPLDDNEAAAVADHVDLRGTFSRTTRRRGGRSTKSHDIRSETEWFRPVASARIRYTRTKKDGDASLGGVGGTARREKEVLGNERNEMDNDDDHDNDKKEGQPHFYAIMWPHDSVHDVVRRVTQTGSSPFLGESVVVYPDDLAIELKRMEERAASSMRANKGGTTTTTTTTTMDSTKHDPHSPLLARDLASAWKSTSSKQANVETSHRSKATRSSEAKFWWQSLYDPRSLLSHDAQMTIVSAISMFQAPSVLVFGSGLDSSMLCGAVIDLSNRGEVYFLEDDAEWAERTRETLRRIGEGGGDGDDGGDGDRCNVINVRYHTVIDDWLDYVGTEEDMTRMVARYLPNRLLRREFDVVLVDGPIGNSLGAGQPGRMASIAMASRMVRSDGMGVVFIDDMDRLVEQVFSGYLLRPLFGGEHRVPGWGNTRKTVFFTKNDAFVRTVGALERTD